MRNFQDVSNSPIGQKLIIGSEKARDPSVPMTPEDLAAAAVWYGGCRTLTHLSGEVETFAEKLYKNNLSFACCFTVSDRDSVARQLQEAANSFSLQGTGLTHRMGFEMIDAAEQQVPLLREELLNWMYGSD